MTSTSPVARVARWLLPAGWLAGAIGYFGPWVAHRTAALILTGPDMAEFCKFLPGVIDGSLHVARQVFYLPPLAIILGVALLVGSRAARYRWPVRAAALLLSIPLSGQVLPPAWSPASLLTAEFRLQPVALALLWIALAAFWLLGRLPVLWAGLVAGLVALLAAILAGWQFLAVKPAIDAVYGRPPALGWGWILCLAGLLMAALASTGLALRARESRS